MRKPFICFLLAAFILSFIAGAQPLQRASTGKERMKAFKQHEKLISASPYKNLQWRNVGPDIISGRCTDVWGISGNKNIIYAAFATGGLWKTEDAGKTWQPLFDNEATQNFGTFAIAASDPNIIYAGTGEANIFRASLPGNGAYKSTDGGKIWKRLGLENTSTIARVVIHPVNPDIVYIAASGNEWSYNNDRGLYQTTNGGKTWKRILYKDDKTGCIDLVMDPSDPNTLYASMWNRIRKRWSDPVPEDGDHLYKSTDGGKTWKIINNGLPETKFTGRIGLAISRSNSNVLYAYIDNHTPKREPKANELDPYGRPIQVVPMGVQVWRSDDKGESWKKVSTEDDKLERFAGTYGWVFGQIRVDPNNENVVYIMGVPIAKSTDGGKTFTIMRSDGKESERLHGDHHALWIDPADSDYIINGNDGGVVVSYNGGKNWKNFFDVIPTTQFYNVTYDMHKPYSVYGSVQDEGSYMASIKNTFGTKDTTIKRWQAAPGGEGTIIALDPVDKDIMYASSFYGRLVKSDLSKPRTQWWKNIGIKKTDTEDVLRGEWLAYTFISPHDHLTVYHGMQYVFKSSDSGAIWKRISHDLTYKDTVKMGRTPYAINHQAITAMDESPLKKGLLYAGTDDGRVWVTMNDGGEWKEVAAGLPVNSHTSRLVASKYNEATVYVTLSDRREDNIKTYIFISNDYGATWKSIAGNLPPSPVNVVREDPKNKNILYCGTDIGIYISKDGGKKWQSLQGNLPAAVSVQDLFIHPRDNNLVIATYGRGVYVVDDIKKLQE